MISANFAGKLHENTWLRVINPTGRGEWTKMNFILLQKLIWFCLLIIVSGNFFFSFSIYNKAAESGRSQRLLAENDIQIQHLK